MGLGNIDFWWHFALLELHWISFVFAGLFICNWHFSVVLDFPGVAVFMENYTLHLVILDVTDGMLTEHMNIIY